MIVCVFQSLYRLDWEISDFSKASQCVSSLKVQA